MFSTSSKRFAMQLNLIKYHWYSAVSEKRQCAEHPGYVIAKCGEEKLQCNVKLSSE